MTVRPSSALIYAGVILTSGLIIATPFTTTAARAQTTTYTTSADFLAAVQGASYTETFDGTLEAVSAVSYSFLQNGFGYTVTVPPPTFDTMPVYRNGIFIGNLTDGESLVFTFTTGNVTAVGGNFFLTNLTDNFVSSPITVTLNDGTTTTYTPTGVDTFLGFTSTVAITSLTLSVTNIATYNSVDNLIVGTTSAAPEPGSLALVLPVMGAVGMVIRKRQRRK
jgi:hypothetical protein